MADLLTPAPTDTQETGSAQRGAGPRGLRRLLRYAGALPFFAFVAVFLLWPTGIIAIGAFTDAAGRPTMSNIEAVLSGRNYVDAFVRSIELSATKYCPVNAMVSAGATAVHHRFVIHEERDGSTLDGLVVTTGPYRRPDVVV